MAEGGMGHRVASIMEVIDVTDVTEDTTANMDTGTSTEGLKKMKWFFFCNCFTQHLLLLHVLLVSRLCYMQFQLNSFLRYFGDSGWGSERRWGHDRHGRQHHDSGHSGSHHRHYRRRGSRHHGAHRCSHYGGSH
ncbi:uncharacterized protein LOC111247520 isoform X2 [Varroa destructor]|uniref:Uncharacterized protein n=1 Tax=Varroa destructor TaxID=109461 RepID=A0A7M7MDL6_VARDE|nr:uncharacterized protein LOC111247520 isoform X2 [Varroa destructor]